MEQITHAAAKVAIEYLHQNHAGVRVGEAGSGIVVRTPSETANAIAIGVQKKIREWEDGRLQRSKPLDDEERIMVSVHPVQTMDDDMREIIFHFFSPVQRK